ENDRRLSQARAGANAVGELRLVRKEQLDDASGYHAMVERVVDEFLGWQSEDRDWLVIEQEIRLLAMRDEEFGRYLLGYHGVVCEGLQRILTEALGRNGLRFTIDDTSAVRIALAVYTESNVQRAMGAAEEDIRLRDKLVFLIEAITEPVSPGRVE
ncbi:hypothetical protein, partial [Brooklawnia cerclae]